VNYVDPDGKEPQRSFTALDREVGEIVALGMKASLLGALLPKQNFEALVTGGAKKLGDRGAGLVEFVETAARVATPASVLTADDPGSAARAYAKDAGDLATGLLTAPLAAVSELAGSLGGLGAAALDPSTSLEQVGYDTAGAGLGIADVATLATGARAALSKLKGTFGLGTLTDEVNAGVAAEFKGMNAADVGIGPTEAGTVGGARGASGPGSSVPKDVSAGTPSAQATGGSFEILDGVRREKAAELAGVPAVRAEVINSGGRVVEVPIDALRSPKSAIDATTTSGRTRWMNTLRQTLSGSQPPPILVQPGTRGTRVRDVKVEY